MEEEGITFLINNAHISGRASLDINDLAFFAKLGFINMTAGGVGTNSGVHLLAEATLTLDEDGNIATTNDRQFSFDDLISGAIFDALLFDFNGFGEARLKGLNVNPNIPGLDETVMSTLEISVTVPDFTDMSGVEVVTQGEVTQSQIDQFLALKNVVVVQI